MKDEMEKQFSDEEVGEMEKNIPASWQEAPFHSTATHSVSVPTGVPAIEVGRKSKKIQSRALVVRLSEVQPEPISWLWEGRIALGKLTLIAGDPGLGKSLLTATFAAHISKGYPWPVDGTVPPVGDVVLLSAEDDPADTIRPRLDAAGADCSRVHILRAIKEQDDDGVPTQRMFSFKRDLVALEGLLKSLPDCKLLVVDPVSAYLDGADSHNNTDVRGLLAPLAELAAQYKVAVILIQHLNKGGGGSAIYRSIGSIAFIAAARAAYVITKDTENPLRRLFMPAKNNLAQDSTGLAYAVITAENGAPVIVWEKVPVEITADEALAQPDSNEERTNNDWAVLFLQDLLENGRVLATEVHKKASSARITTKILRRAQSKLGIVPFKDKTIFNGPWWWVLPGQEDAQNVEDAHPKTKGALDVERHLGGAEVNESKSKAVRSDSIS